MTWQPGSDRVRELLTAGELEQVVPDQALADRLLQDAQRHLDTAATATESGDLSGDLSGAYQLAYDAFRKSGAALLAAQGLRATSRGGHIAIQDSITAQFGNTVRVFRSFGRIRRARNSFEYPDADAAGPMPDDVHDAIQTATKARAAAATILNQTYSLRGDARPGSTIGCLYSEVSPKPPSRRPAPCRHDDVRHGRTAVPRGRQM